MENGLVIKNNPIIWCLMIGGDNAWFIWNVRGTPDFNFDTEQDIHQPTAIWCP